MDSSDLNALTQGLVDSMTLFLRNSSDTNELNGTTHAIGTAWGNQAFVHVRWPWLFTPAMMVILTLALLIVVMVQNARRKCCVWKSSILASIYHGLERWPDEPVEQVTEMEHMAKKAAVNLSRSDDGRLALLAKKLIIPLTDGRMKAVVSTDAKKEIARPRHRRRQARLTV